MSTIERNYYNMETNDQNMENLPDMINFAHISGIVNGDVVYDHEHFGEAFFTMVVRVVRRSGTPDYIPVTISSRLLNEKYTDGSGVTVEGQVRTYNKMGGDGREHLQVRLFARDAWNDYVNEENFVALTGKICKPPVYRTTPFGREICDVMIAVNREFGKRDYIPCITWGRTARFVYGLPVGSRVKLTGRFQSRKYEKLGETRDAYEISVHHLEVPAE